MSTKVFINMATHDLPKGTAFYEAIGFVKNPQFSNDSASGLCLDDSIYVMLHTKASLQGFFPNREILVDATKMCEVSNALDRQSKADVDTFMEKVLAAGGKEFKDPYDYGFMYGRTFEDLDGHIWEVFYLDITQMPKQG